MNAWKGAGILREKSWRRKKKERGVSKREKCMLEMLLWLIW
jgi:hypothetical protein